MPPSAKRTGRLARAQEPEEPAGEGVDLEALKAKKAAAAKKKDAGKKASAGEAGAGRRPPCAVLDCGAAPLGAFWLFYRDGAQCQAHTCAVFLAASSGTC